MEEIVTAADNVPVVDIFRTLELDRAAMVEQRKLEVHIACPYKQIFGTKLYIQQEYEAQEELNEAEEEKENSTAKSVKKKKKKKVSLFDFDHIQLTIM